jgi:O-antigen/teichoic acid export membrane protein
MGTIKRQGIKNTIFTYAGVSIGFLNLLVLMPFILKSEELGLIRIMYSATILFGTLYPIGLNFLTIRYFPRFRNEANKHNGYLGLLILVSLAGFFLLAFLTFLFDDEIVSHYRKNSGLFVKYFYYVVPIGFFIGTTTIFTGYLNALFKSTVPTFLNEVFLRIWMSFLLFLYLYKAITFSMLMFLYMGSYGTMVIFLLFYIIKNGDLGLKINWPFFRQLPLREVTKYTLLLALASIASIGIRNVDTLFIGSSIGLDAVAVYSIAFTIGSIIETPVNALGKIADSKISSAIAAGDTYQMKQIYYKSTKYMTILGGVLFLFICVNIKDGLLLLPAKFHGSEMVVYIVGLSSFFNMATGLNTSLIYYSNYYVLGTWMLFLMIVISIILNMLLIPLIGIIGAALATSAALFVYNVLKFWLIYAKFKFQPFGLYGLKIVLIVGILFFLGINLNMNNNLVLKMIMRSSIIFVLFITLFKILKVDEELWHELKSFRWRNK